MSKAKRTGFIYLPAHHPKTDSRIRKGSRVRMRRREFPKTSDGTTAGDRAGWIVEYEALVTVRGKWIPEVKILKQVKTAGEIFDLEVAEKLYTPLQDLELIK